MTKCYFEEYVTTIGEIVDFARDIDYDLGLIDYDECCRRINDDIYETLADGWEWYEIREHLEEIDEGYEYYACGDGFFEYSGVTDWNIDDYKSAIADYADGYNLWDEEETEEEYEEDVGDGESFEIEENISVRALIAMCVSECNDACAAEENEEREKNTEFDRQVTRLFSCKEREFQEL